MYLNMHNQAHVIPELLSSSHGPLLTGRGGAAPRDVFVCAPTGCGKTLCYVLPIVSALLNRVVCQVSTYNGLFSRRVMFAKFVSQQTTTK